MIQQSSTNPAGIAIDPKPVTTPPDDPKGQWHRFEVIRLGRELVRSINPFYVPDNSLPTVPGVAAGIDLPALDSQTSHCQGFNTLAARAIAAWANFPPEIDQALGYLANLLAAGQAASDQFDALTAAAVVVPEPGTDREIAQDETVENAKKKTGKAPQYPRRQPDKFATAMLRASQLPNTSLALGALVGFSAVGASSASGSDWKHIYTADELKKICTDETGYKCDIKYKLARDITIDASQWKPIGSLNRPFKGELNGLNHNIRNLPDCLITKLAGNATIQNLRFTSANIASAKKAAGVVACRMSENALVRNIHVEHANLVSTSNKGANAGIVVGLVNTGNVFNITARNCTVNATGFYASAGIGAGLIKKSGKVNKTMALNCNVLASGYSSNVGIGAGKNQGIVRNTLAFKCQVLTRGSLNAGIGAGYNEGVVRYTTAYKCTVLTNGINSYAGIGAGTNTGTVRKTTAYKCKVLTYGGISHAGIGAGYNEGVVRYTTAYKCKVLTYGRISHAGIGAGSSQRGTNSNWTVISDTAAFGCNVSTTESFSNAAIGAGYIEYPGSIKKTTAVKCTVTTTGTQSHAGIGVGKTNKGEIVNTTVIKSTVQSEKEDSNAAINGGPETTVCNATIINGQKTEPETYTNNCYIDLNTACEGFDPGLVRKNCQEVPGGLFGTNALPTYPNTKPLTTVSALNFSSPDSHITTTPPTTPAKFINTTSPGQGSVTSATSPLTLAPLSSTKIPLVGPGSASSVTAPTTPAPLSSSNLPLSSTGSATITTPPTNAPGVTDMTASSSVSARFATPPLTESLSPALIAIIATLGAACVVLFAVIGVYTHRNYYRRSSTNAGRNQPMPEQPERRLRAERPLPSVPGNDYQLLPVSPVNTSSLPAPPQNHYQLLSGNQGNTSALPAFLQGHYQSLSDNRGNGRTLPQSHYQPLTGRRGNLATGGSNPLVGNPAPPPSDYPAQPVYENIDNYRIPLANGQARTAPAGSTMASTGHELPPGQQRPDSPLHPVMTEPETDSDHSYDEPAMIALAVMATGGSSHGERW